MDLTPDDKSILERALKFERTMEPMRLALGWTWDDIQCWPAQLNKLIIKGAIRVSFRSNSGTNYRVTDAGTLAMIPASPTEVKSLSTEVDDSHMFDSIVGHDDIKELIKVSLTLDKPVHVLLVGPPALAKSLFLWEIEKVYKNLAVVLLGSGTSKAGMWDVLVERKPKIVLIDELEKMSVVDTTGLLSLMEYGRIVRAKVGRELDEKLTVWVIATANTTHRLPPELLSRFKRKEMAEYGNIEFVRVVTNVLMMNEDSTEEEAMLIASKLVGKTHDIRDAVRVARMSKKTGVERALELLM